MAQHHDILQKLHTRLLDSHDGYRQSREEVKDERLFVTFFDRLIEQRKDFARTVHAKLEAEGQTVSDEGSTAAAAHRAWLKLRDAVTGDDEAVYAEVINGETDLLSVYDEAIEETRDLPAWQFLHEQREAVKAAIEEAKAEKQRHAA